MTVRLLAALAWTACWPVVAFFAIGFAMMGDPVEGGFAQRQLLARALVLVAGAVFVAGYWLIFRKRTR